MIHKTIDISHAGENATLTTYILNNSPQIDPNRKRPIVIICPGGGYQFTSDREAEPIAIQMNAMGFHACVLWYSVAPAVFPTALCQLASAIGQVREHAEEWNVDTTKIVVLGFSAGGHLAASIGVFWNKEFLTDLLPFSSEQIKPNGIVLCYPVISSGEYAHQGSFKALAGDKYGDRELLELLSLEKQVSQETPPTFLWHTATDLAVPVQNSTLFADALLKNNVSMEMHIYPRGAHGLSLGTEETKGLNNEASIQTDVVNWIDMVGRWINNI
ncbi:alpha/beta hydrolase [Fredinandcohnia sp. 179-A 10B2 NHS]|uniref:alpha/beta hydrolase n=1 Tax=Fredinandcohnia sp. 179-A 10B2 NHS TaxID=3235176 RepID=UPI0039A36BF6